MSQKLRNKTTRTLLISYSSNPPSPYRRKLSTSSSVSPNNKPTIGRFFTLNYSFYYKKFILPSLRLIFVSRKSGFPPKVLINLSKSGENRSSNGRKNCVSSNLAQKSGTFPSGKSLSVFSSQEKVTYFLNSLVPRVTLNSKSDKVLSGNYSSSSLNGTGSRYFHTLKWLSRVRRLSTKDKMMPAAAASLSLPIVGSPPFSSDFSSIVGSPMDDISALSGAFAAARPQNKRFQLRRKLSTSFDDPVSSLLLGIVAEKARTLERRGSDDLTKRDGQGDAGGGGAGGGGTWLEEHFRKFNQLRISEGSEGEGDDSSSGGGSETASRNSRRGSVFRIQDDVFQLLEKVIAFRGRNVSHITVEQSVKDLCTVYNETSEADKLRFFNLLGDNYGVEHEAIISLANSLASSQDEQLKLNLEEKLRAALIPKYQWLFSQVGRLENGVKFLVDLRTDVIDAIEKSVESTTQLKALNNCLKDLITVWFAVGFLKLERITWNSSCEMLQKVSEYEAVHPMRNWTDLKKRVGPNRRCFVFTHGSMPEEPVVVLHTALTNHIPACIHKIVTKRRMMSIESDSDVNIAEEVEDPDYIDTAIFYSITSTQRGLTGIELGNYLIKKVVRELQSEFPKMNQFSSLSPIPGFSKWLLGSLKTAQRDPQNQKVLTNSEIAVLKPVFESIIGNDERDIFTIFQDLLKLNEWYSHEELQRELEKPLMRLCGQYLYLVKRRGYAMDPVAHFHLKNGSVMWRLNWLADSSPRGLGQSCGIMVNYRYFLEDCETNSQTYLEQQTIQISDQIRQLVNRTESEMDSKM